MPELTTEMVELMWRQFYSRELISRYQLEGLQHAQLHAFMDYHMDAMVMQLHGYIMSTPAGGLMGFDHHVDVMLPIRPWWIPKRLWARIPTVRGRWYKHVEVRPEWIYPQATVQVPDLGRGVKFLYLNTNTTREP